MKKVWLLSLLLLTLIGYSLFTLKSERLPPEKRVERTIVEQVDSLSAFTARSFLPAVESGKANAEELQKYFLYARLLYKQFEWAAEYFTGSTSLFVNGPPVQELTVAGPLVQAFNPAGLQVIEALLFPRYDTADKQMLRVQLQGLASSCAAYRAYYTHIPIADWQIFDAAKLEVFRILTLGITGFDDPLTLHSMDESAVSLSSLSRVLTPYAHKGRDGGLISLIDSAAAYLRMHPDFDTFDRAAFIIHFGNRITAQITDLEKTLHIPEIRYNRLLRQDAKTLFDTGAFDADAYAPGPGYDLSPARIALGKKLFYDPRVSGTGTRSCASCHQPEKAFTDGLVTNTNIHGTNPLPRNTPTLLNAALQASLFYDLRASSLEEQVRDVVSNKQEMHGSLGELAERLSKDSVYRPLFTRAFPGSSTQPVDTFEIMNAIGSYVRSLAGLSSRFDRYMRGDAHALSRDEVNGFNLFMGKAKCATCHYLPLFNGTVPPKYTISDAEVIGVPAKRHGTAIDPDPGWYDIVKIASFLHAFKTPTVRNAARTAPYMHNGVFGTLDELMEFYNDGGGKGMGLDVKNQTLAPDSLHLTPPEIRDIIAFIGSLNSR